MSSEPVIESGLQVITRLFDRPSVQDLEKDLFFNKLENTDLIEIVGTVSSGVTVLLTKLIAKCILPLQYDGLGGDVLFINTENQFRVSWLYELLQSEISSVLGPINVDKHVEEVLNNLKVLNSYDHHQFFLLMNSLDNVLLNHKKVFFIVIDSIGAYFWQQKDDLSYSSYLLKMLNIIKKIAEDFKVVVLYTRPFNFQSKKKRKNWFDGKKLLRYEISLITKENSDEFICNVKEGKDEKELYYKINDFNFEWIKQENKKES